MNSDDPLDILWNDYLNLAEKHSDKLNIPEFGYYLIQFASRMLFDSAPTQQAAKELISDAVQSGQAWSLSETQQ